jgi:hypothetical protein
VDPEVDAKIKEYGPPVPELECLDKYFDSYQRIYNF